MERYYVIEFNKWIKDLDKDKTLSTKTPTKRIVLFISECP